MTTKIQAIIRMTRAEVERVVIPHFDLGFGAYHYWWDNELIVVRPMPKPFPKMEGPVLIMFGNMPVEVVDEVDSDYNDFSNIGRCRCGRCKSRVLHDD